MGQITKASTNHLMIDYDNILGSSVQLLAGGDEFDAPDMDIVGHLQQSAKQRKSNGKAKEMKSQPTPEPSRPQKQIASKRQRGRDAAEDDQEAEVKHQHKKQKGPHGLPRLHGDALAMSHVSQRQVQGAESKLTEKLFSKEQKQQQQLKQPSHQLQTSNPTQPPNCLRQARPGAQTPSQTNQKHDASKAKPLPSHSKPAAQSSQPHKPGPGSSKGGRWPFKVDYNDHFETSRDACADLAPALDALAAALGKTRATLVLYDPFFCAGGVVRHWAALGFKSVIHRNRDFYADITSGQLPEYDVLVTNPPYSADHKERAFEFCLGSGKPWALLLPNYVANKAYYADQLAQHGCMAEDARPGPSSSDKQPHKPSGRAGPQGRSSQQGLPQPFYIVPSQKYEYAHPEGAGHSSSPFFSIWYVHLGRHTDRVFSACSEAAAANGVRSGGDRSDRKAARFVRSVQGLGAVGAVPTWKRPNPRQRKKLAAGKAARS